VEVNRSLITIPPLSTESWASGYHLQQLFPDLDASLYEPATKSAETVLLLLHPTVGFLHHYALQPLAERGYAAMGLNTRYAWNDSTLEMENVALDIAAAVAVLRRRGFKHVILVGNSGGGAAVSFYQSQAESPSVTATPAGDPPDLTNVRLEAADGLVLLNAHPGRAEALTHWMDPAITDETDQFATDPDLDMFNAKNGPPYSAAFVERYRTMQRARNQRITDWVWDQLKRRSSGVTKDVNFIVYRTMADLRFLDLSLDPSDRPVGCLRGDTLTANYGVTGLGRFCTGRSWLSQWSLSASNGSAEHHLSRISVPALVVQGTADTGVFMSEAKGLFDAVPHSDKQFVPIPGGNHYFSGQPHELAKAIDSIDGWLRAHRFD
jgi:pimeloyl-ACP methyl ester carboxylesterase